MRKSTLIRIVDDDPSLGDALSFMLSMEGWKVKAYTSARDFLADDSPSIPGCLILDVRMPEMTGLQLQELLNERQWRHPIIFLSAHGDIDMAVGTMEKGAFTFLQKPVEDERLLSAVARAIDHDLKKTNEPFDLSLAERKFASLSAREREIIVLISKGLLNRDVALQLGISERTVENHRASIYKKLTIRSSAELMNFCIRLRLIQ